MVLQPVYNIRDAFKELKVSHVVGYRLIDSGILQSYTVGRRRYATGEQVQRCIDRLAAGEYAANAPRSVRARGEPKAARGYPASVQG